MFLLCILVSINEAKNLMDKTTLREQPSFMVSSQQEIEIELGKDRAPTAGPGRGILPKMDYTGMHLPKGGPFSDLRSIIG